jgi:hypothetical protein
LRRVGSSAYKLNNRRVRSINRRVSRHREKQEATDSTVVEKRTRSRKLNSRRARSSSYTVSSYLVRKSSKRLSSHRARRRSRRSSRRRVRSHSIRSSSCRTNNRRARNLNRRIANSINKVNSYRAARNRWSKLEHKCRSTEDQGQVQDVVPRHVFPFPKPHAVAEIEACGYCFRAINPHNTVLAIQRLSPRYGLAPFLHCQWYPQR